jgi:hypothetical protein
VFEVTVLDASSLRGSVFLLRRELTKACYSAEVLEFVLTLETAA